MLVVESEGGVGYQVSDEETSYDNSSRGGKTSGIIEEKHGDSQREF